MGGSSPQIYKDPSINVLITFSKSFYYAGEMVEGVVYVECLASKPYKELLLRLQGNERVHWTQQSGDSTNDYDNTRETYNQVFTFLQFPNRFRKGKYNFPFSLLLPAAFPASFDYGSYNFIKYSLSVIFVPFDNKSPSPIYERTLHLREPPRLPPGQMGFRLQQFAPIGCCCCVSCCDCGQVELTLQSEVSALTPGQTFRTFGRINNIGGSSQIEGFCIILSECIKRVTQRGQSTVLYPHRFALHSSSRSIPIGQDHQFDLMLRVPVKGPSYTAVGNIIYRAYFLELRIILGSCYSNPQIKRHVIVNSDIEPAADEYAAVRLPAGWNPEVAPAVSFLNLQPYIYQSNRLIDVRNQFGMPIQVRNMKNSPLAYQPPS